ncbi:hypothetical protein HKCCE2091_18300 [Rhodobacterales bacterium HKCCE2091]|nr:hypothetical protein [Rhodobacterales bacterium HKCCE2091]
MIPRLAAALAARGRWCLVAGLLVGVGSPAAAEAVRPAVGTLVAVLLFLAMLRIGPGGWRIGLRGFGRGAAIAAMLQVALPLAAFAVFAASGLADRPLAQGVVLILAAAPITGAAHIAAMAGGDPAPALVSTVIGTALLPLTVLPVFALAGVFGGTANVAAAALRLLAIVAAAGGLAALARATGAVKDTAAARTAIDATAAVLLGVVVVGIMAGAARALRSDPAALLLTLAAVTLLVVALQAATLEVRPGRQEALPLAVVVANRNVALFLGALPEPAVAPLLLVIGCYQVPMYLTPLILPRLATALSAVR